MLKHQKYANVVVWWHKQIDTLLKKWGDWTNSPTRLSLAPIRTRQPRNLQRLNHIHLARCLLVYHRTKIHFLIRLFFYIIKFKIEKRITYEYRRVKLTVRPALHFYARGPALGPTTRFKKLPQKMAEHKTSLAIHPRRIRNSRSIIGLFTLFSGRYLFFGHVTSNFDTWPFRIYVWNVRKHILYLCWPSVSESSNAEIQKGP